MLHQSCTCLDIVNGGNKFPYPAWQYKQNYQKQIIYEKIKNSNIPYHLLFDNSTPKVNFDNLHFCSFKVQKT